MGLLHLDDDIPASMASQVIESMQMGGVHHASEAVKSALSDRVR
jgi:hypothetical protein